MRAISAFQRHAMASETGTPLTSSLGVLKEIHTTLQKMQQDYRQLSSAVEAVEGKVNLITGINQLQDAVDQHESSDGVKKVHTHQAAYDGPLIGTPTSSLPGLAPAERPQNAVSGRKPSPTTRIILTTYPGQAGIDPLEMSWGHKNPRERGPVVVSRSHSTVRRRNGEFRLLVDC